MTTPTDAEIAALYAEETGFAIDDSPAALLDFARAVLAKWGQPQAVASGEPLTANQAQELIELESWGVDAITLNAQLMRTIRRTEAAHGITKGGQHGAE